MELIEVSRMTRLVFATKAKEDGSVSLNLPAGTATAGEDLQVCIEAAPSSDLPTPEEIAEHGKWVDEIAGSWEGELDRPYNAAATRRSEL